jgi:magnesium and cobalt exporter, CNNM family
MLISALVFLIGSFFLQTTSSALGALENVRSREQLEASRWFRFYRSILPATGVDRLFFSVSCAKHTIRFLFIVTATLYLVQWPLFLIGLFFLSLLVADFLPRALGTRFSEASLRLTPPITTLFLLLSLPITYPILLLTGRHLASLYVEEVGAPVGEVKEKIMEMIEEAQAETQLDATEKELLEGFASFHDRIVREVMIPRVDVEALPHNATLQEAVDLFDHERYSRIPVYRNTIDSITGLLLYKDVMRAYLASEDHSQPIDTLTIPVLYVPETSRLSSLLQEFRAKQSHFAVVVDEYGGTEGIVTMEDCLEELVGEIEDETDEEEPELFTVDPTGGWIVDARMPIHDIEEQFDIKIPQEGDYDTIGGYAFHRAGEIPTKGLQIHSDEFDLEILEVTERNVVSVRLTRP